MSASFVTCSGCAKMYRTRNGFARHALTVHQSLGLGSGLLLPLSGDALVTRQDDLRARDRRRHVRKTPVEPLDLRVVTSNRVRPIAASSTLSSAADQSTPSSFREGRAVRSLPCISDVIRRQMTAVVETSLLYPEESPEIVSRNAGYEINCLMDLIIASTAVNAHSALRQAMQPSTTEASLSDLLASIHDIM